MPDLVVAEYQSLRTEIVKLMELQGQLIALVVLAFGTIVSVGIQAKNGQLLLVHPLLAMILGISWLNHAHGIKRCAKYLRTVEDRVGPNSLGWETFVQANRIRLGKLGSWGLRSIFPVSSVLALVLAAVIGSTSTSMITMFAISSVVTLTTLILFIVYY